jgi:hypothetical protein
MATESEFGSDGDVVPSTPPNGGSPLTWGKLKLNSSTRFDVCVNERIASNGTDMGLNLGGDPATELSALVKRMDLTPRFEKKFVFGEIGEQESRRVKESEKTSEDETKPTRFLLVSVLRYV